MMATISSVSRIDDQDFIADDDVVEAFILRHDFDDVVGQHFDMHAARHPAPTEMLKFTLVVDARGVIMTDDRVDLAALIFGELHRCAAGRRRGLVGIALGRIQARLSGFFLGAFLLHVALRHRLAFVLATLSKALDRLCSLALALRRLAAFLIESFLARLRAALLAHHGAAGGGFRLLLGALRFRRALIALIAFRGLRRRQRGKPDYGRCGNCSQ